MKNVHLKRTYVYLCVCTSHGCVSIIHVYTGSLTYRVHDDHEGTQNGEVIPLAGVTLLLWIETNAAQCMIRSDSTGLSIRLNAINQVTGGLSNIL